MKCTAGVRGVFSHLLKGGGWYKSVGEQIFFLCISSPPVRKFFSPIFPYYLGKPQNVPFLSGRLLRPCLKKVIFFLVDRPLPTFYGFPYPFVSSFYNRFFPYLFPFNPVHLYMLVLGVLWSIYLEV